MINPFKLFKFAAKYNKNLESFYDADFIYQLLESVIISVHGTLQANDTQLSVLNSDKLITLNSIEDDDHYLIISSSGFGILYALSSGRITLSRLPKENENKPKTLLSIDIEITNEDIEYSILPETKISTKNDLRDIRECLNELKCFIKFHEIELV